jgi:hypothetical protein
MSLVQPNVSLYSWGCRDKRSGVKVAGVPIGGVVEVSLVQRNRPDGWTDVTP